MQHPYKSHGSIIRTTGEDVDLIEHVISNFVVFFSTHFNCCPWHTPFSTIYGACGPSFIFYVFVDIFQVFTNIGFIFCAIRNLSCVYISIHRYKKTQKKSMLLQHFLKHRLSLQKFAPGWLDFLFGKMSLFKSKFFLQ